MVMPNVLKAYITPAIVRSVAVTPHGQRAMIAKTTAINGKIVTVSTAVRCTAVLLGVRRSTPTTGAGSARSIGILPRRGLLPQAYPASTQTVGDGNMYAAFFMYVG